MAFETILQHEILTNFIYPFILMFIILYAILEKTKVFGDEAQQINAILSLVVALIFVSVASPKLIVGNLILFLTIALVVMFIILLLWSFAMGNADSLDIFGKIPKLKGVIGGVIVLAVIVAIFWAAGIGTSTLEFLFKQEWSKSFWTNFAFVAVVVGTIAWALKK